MTIQANAVQDKFGSALSQSSLAFSQGQNRGIPLIKILMELGADKAFQLSDLYFQEYPDMMKKAWSNLIVASLEFSGLVNDPFVKPYYDHFIKMSKGEEVNVDMKQFERDHRPYRQDNLRHRQFLLFLVDSILLDNHDKDTGMMVKNMITNRFFTFGKLVEGQNKLSRKQVISIEKANEMMHFELLSIAHSESFAALS